MLDRLLDSEKETRNSPRGRDKLFRKASHLGLIIPRAATIAGLTLRVTAGQTGAGLAAVARPVTGRTVRLTRLLGVGPQLLKKALHGPHGCYHRVPHGIFAMLDLHPRMIDLTDVSKKSRQAVPRG